MNTFEFFFYLLAENLPAPHWLARASATRTGEPDSRQLVVAGNRTGWHAYPLEEHDLSPGLWFNECFKLRRHAWLAIGHISSVPAFVFASKDGVEYMRGPDLCTSHDCGIPSLSQAFEELGTTKTLTPRWLRTPVSTFGAIYRVIKIKSTVFF